jgi:zinc transporter ZupT
MHAAWGEVFAATAVAWSGVVTALLLRKACARFMRPLVYVALFALAGVAVFDILPASKAALSWPTFVGAVALGYGTLWCVGRYVAPVCPACAMRRFESAGQHAHGGGLIALAVVLGIHCFLDGLGMSAASTVDASFGVRVLSAVAIHKLPEGFALGIILMAGGRSPWRAFALATAIEAATLGGPLTTILWTHPSAFWLSLVLAHLGGTFLYLSATAVWDALWPLPPMRAVRT